MQVKSRFLWAQVVRQAGAISQAPSLGLTPAQLPRSQRRPPLKAPGASTPQTRITTEKEPISLRT